jgi:hypothetical protein
MSCKITIICSHFDATLLKTLRNALLYGISITTETMSVKENPLRERR